MAYRIEKQSPLDVTERKAIGIKLPFNALFTSTYQTIDAYKTNLINYLLTDKGERYFNPEFGANLRSLLFEPSLSSLQRKGIESDLAREISIYFPRLVIDNIELTDIADHTVQIYLKFHIKDSRLGDELVVNFE